MELVTRDQDSVRTTCGWDMKLETHLSTFDSLMSLTTRDTSELIESYCNHPVLIKSISFIAVFVANTHQ